MKRLLFFALTTGIFWAFYLYTVATIALVLIVFGAAAIFSPLIISTCRFNSPILYIGDMEENIIYALNREKKISKNEGWLTLDQILLSINVEDMNDDLTRRGYQIALCNLDIGKIIEIKQGNTEPVYRLIVECVPKEGMGAGFHCRQLPCAT